MEDSFPFIFILLMLQSAFNGCISQIRGTGPVFILEPRTPVVFSNSRGAIINCLVHGDPEPVVRWMTSTGEVQTDVQRYLEILRNNSMVFSPFATGEYQHSIHANSFRCEASNRYGTIVSNIVQVKAIVDQQYSTQVYDEYIIEGNTAVFKCHIPSYIKDFVEVRAWIRNGHLRITKAYKKGSRYYITKGGNLHVSNVDRIKDSNSIYKCETSHKISGKTTVSENGAELHISSLSSSIPPKITDITQSLEATVGESIILPCVAQAYPKPTYSWCLKSERGGSCREIDPRNFQRWKAIKDGSFQVTVQDEDSGTYICRASNEMGQEQAATKLSVFSPISVFIHPQAQIANIGEVVRIECVTSGGPIQSLNWMKNGVELNESKKNQTSGGVLKIEAANVSTAGMYQCFVGNNMETKQASAQISLSAIPPELKRTFQKNILDQGGTLQLKCTATGDPLPEITWKIRQSVIKPSRRVKISRDSHSGKIRSTLVIEDVSNLDGGLYSCDASNKVGTVSYSQFVHVYGDLHVWPLQNMTAITGEKVVLQCHVSGYPVEEITWFKDGKALMPSRRMKLNSNGSVVISATRKKSDAGNYECGAQNNRRQSTSRIGKLAVIEPPRLNHGVKNAILTAGERLQLLCTISKGDPPIKFKWTYNGLTIPHSLDIVIADSVLSSTLTGSNVDRGHAGNYTCGASNKAGKVTQNTAILIEDSPIWAVRPKDRYESDLSLSIEIPCQGKGYPLPHSSWHKIIGDKMADIKNSSRISVSSKSSLIIREIIESDFGKFYVCTVTNGIDQDLQQKVELFKTNSITFKNAQNNLVAKRGEEMRLKCQVEKFKDVSITWHRNSKILKTRVDKRLQILNSAVINGVKSILKLSKVRRTDSGFYVCKAFRNNLSNSTRFYLSVEGATDDLMSSVYGNGSESIDMPHHQGNLKNKQSNSSRTSNDFQFYGMALLYVIPTVTAAVILFAILIIVCVLLRKQQRKRKKFKNREIEMSRSLQHQEKDFNSYDYRTGRKRSSISKSSETYYEVKPKKCSFDDNYHSYSQMSSASDHPGTGSIVPYATFRSCTDPVPPIPINETPFQDHSSLRKK